MDCLNALRVYFGWDKHKGSEKGNKKTRYNFHEDYLFCIISTESPKALLSPGLSSFFGLCSAAGKCLEGGLQLHTSPNKKLEDDVK